MSIPRPPASASSSWLRRRGRRTVAILAAVMTLASGLAFAGASVAAARPPVIVAAGDIACGGEPCRSHRRTARLVRRIGPRAVLTLGDNQYPSGSLADFKASYDPTWGTFKERTHPSPGNHEYLTPNARGYFRYFGRRAHRRSEGVYSFNIGRWHIVSFNSGLRPISRERVARVRRDLAADGHRCELAYWHHPRWSSGTSHGSGEVMDRLWRVLFRKGVDVVLNGHEHNYERFALLNPAGEVAPRTGIRQFVVGTGGAELYRFGNPITGSQVRIDDRLGVLKMVLHRGRYTWRFKAPNGDVLDRGRQACHR